MFPPWTSGGMVEWAPSRRRGHAQLAAERRERDANAGQQLAVTAVQARDAQRVLVKSSVSRPKPGKVAVQPQLAGLEIEQLDLQRVARFGPLHRNRAVDLVDPREVDRLRSSTVESSRTWPFEESKASNSTTSPLATVAIGGIERSQARCHWSFAM